jgi:hypothetical protein
MIMPDYERVLDDIEIELENNPIKKSYFIGYKDGKTRARIEVAAIFALVYFTIAAIGYY